jgi:hypothetical protein
VSEEFFQLLIFAIIFLLLPTLEGVLRRRKQQGRGPIPTPDSDWEPDEEERGGEPRDVVGSARPRPARARSSEDLLPQDLWDELKALARGERTLEERAPVAPPSSPPPSVSDTPTTVRAREPEPVGLRSREARVLPPKPAGGTVVRRPRARDAVPGFSDAAPSPIEIGAIGGGARARSGHAGSPEAILATLRAMSSSDMRRAVIFQEVLGPPVAERED